MRAIGLGLGEVLILRNVPSLEGFRLFFDRTNPSRLWLWWNNAMECSSIDFKVGGAHRKTESSLFRFQWFPLSVLNRFGTLPFSSSQLLSKYSFSGDSIFVPLVLETTHLLRGSIIVNEYSCLWMLSRYSNRPIHDVPLNHSDIPKSVALDHIELVDLFLEAFDEDAGTALDHDRPDSDRNSVV